LGFVPRRRTDGICRSLANAAPSAKREGLKVDRADRAEYVTRLDFTVYGA
jgi:hypothetical protein